LSDVVRAIFFFHVLNDFAAADFAKIDVDIGRFSAVQIQKPFK